MNGDLIVQIVELVLSVAASQLKGDDLEQTLLDVIQKGVRTYHDEVGKPLNPDLVGMLSPL